MSTVRDRHSGSPKWTVYNDRCTCPSWQRWYTCKHIQPDEEETEPGSVRFMSLSVWREGQEPADWPHRWSYTEKLDGAFVRWNGSALVTKNGRDVTDKWRVSDSYRKAVDGFVLDGELLRGGNVIFFDVYDAGGTLTYAERMRTLRRAVPAPIRVRPARVPAGKGKLEEVLARWASEGREGMVLRHDAGLYVTSGRPSTSVKRKSWLFSTARLVSLNSGRAISRRGESWQCLDHTQLFDGYFSLTQIPEGMLPGDLVVYRYSPTDPGASKPYRPFFSAVSQ